MNVSQLLRKKRDGEQLNKDEIEYFINSLVAGDIAESQIGAFLMAIYIQGLTDAETIQLTESMISSGKHLQWCEEWQGLLVDKHSTGGVGDKVSLVLAPVLAACGLKVPMVSGRSLEHTGGTLDKLESIPGFTVDLDFETMKKALNYAGCFISSATSQLCPADKILYQIRDITSTVSSISLIVSSIISKKVVSGSKFLIVDVKVGKAAFCKTIEMARDLAQQLISVSAKLGLCTRVVLSRMDEPLGNAVGNALEVSEAIQCLSGNILSPIYDLVSVLGSNLLEMTKCEGDGKSLIKKVIENGLALESFQKMLLVQGVNEEIVQSLLAGEPELPTAKHTTQILARSSGWVLEVDAWRVGQVCLQLGAGRQTDKDTVDALVGALVQKHIGDKVIEGEVWLTLYHSCAQLGEDVTTYLQEGLIVVDTKVQTPNIVIEVIK